MSAPTPGKRFRLANWLEDTLAAPHTRWVFLAEDDPAMRRALERALEFDGHRVVAAADGRALIDEMKLVLRPGLGAGSILVTDVEMPTMGGFALVDELTAKGIELPVIFMSGLTEFETLRAAREHNARYFFTKPFVLDDFLEAVARLSGRK